MNALLFLVPWWWPALLLLPLLLWAASRGERRADALRRAALGRRETALLGAPAGTRWRTFGAVAAAGLVALALLRPVWGEVAGAPARADVVLCLDVSRSMRARDVVPDRLQAAQREIETLAAAGGAGRLGLVVFAGSAALAVPLAGDLASVAAIAATMDPSAAARGGTDLGAAIDVAAQALQRGGAVAGCIVVLTDGEDFAARGQQAARRAAALGFPVHCLGFGTATGSKIVVEGAGGEAFLRDQSGREVVSALDPASLQAVAAAGDGTYAPGASGSLLRLHEASLNPRARSLAAADPAREPAHRFQWPLLLALLAWMLPGTLPRRRGTRC